MPVDKQPSPDSWDDQSNVTQPPSNDGVDRTAPTDADAVGEPAEYTSGDTAAIENAAGSVPVTSESDAPPPSPTSGEVSAGSGSSSIGSPVGDAGDGSSFLADLARAMQAAAGAERARATEDTDRRREETIAEIRARAAMDASELEQQSEVEIAEIGAWAEGQMDRIRDERERRIEARRESLTRRLDDHRLIADRQVEAIEEAVGAYRAELNGFFNRLDGETDPSAIARLARMRPEFPPLETVAARARTAAAADALGDEPESGQAVVGVMDPSAGTSTASTWAMPEPTMVPAGAAAETETPAAEEAGSSPGEPAAVGPRSSGALLGAVPALRPIGSWLNRDRAEGSGDRDQG
ncbi:MAG TPA: hypothetical protein VH813_04975 [Candidatus Limnocylindrales bacterium]